MAGLSGFTFIATVFIIGLIGIVYIFVSPLISIFLEYGFSLSPGISSVLSLFNTFWTYLPLVAFISLVVYYIVNSMSMN